jgi:arylsulfatase A-like enzyme
MFTDDQPQNCLGVMGNAQIQTPHLDELARRGTLFNHAFVTTAICCSNRACILTGQHMYRHGIKDFKTPLSAAAFDQTYPAILRRSGYRTGYLGKYAIGNPTAGDRELSLPAGKFDEWYGFPQSINFRQEVDGETRYLTEVMTEKAVEFLRATTPDQPFCLTIAFKEPHGPFNYFDPNTPNIYEGVQIPPSPTFTLQDWNSQPDFIRESLNGDGSLSRLRNPESYQEMLRTFYRTVTRADAAVGEILDELGRLGLDENTVVIFSSDHGSLLGDHGLFGKWLMYENSIRVPLIIYDPSVDPKRAVGRRDEMALSIDLAPTILSLAGIEAPETMQGKSLVPILRQEATDWRSQFYYQHTYNTDPPRSPIPVTEGIRTERWKYIRYPETDPVFEQLFDLDADPLERTNLASLEEHAGILAQLRRECELVE